MVSVLIIMVCSYLVGSFPTSIIVARMLKGIDIREYGSGNAGGTNAFRVLGWQAGLVVSLVDVAKGTLATVLISRLRLGALPFDNPTLIMILAGLCAILGHTFTIFAGFRGGKGVAAGAGMIIGLYPLVFVICLVTFALVLFSTGIVSVSSITAAITLPAALFILDFTGLLAIDDTLKVFGLLIPLFIIYTHRENIRRLLKGEERGFEKVAIFRRKKKS